ncbi:MAG: YihY/virulence factor BrkB family protein [Solirubrobacteraceae bacterium]
MRSRLADPRPGPRLELADFKNAFKRFQKDQMGDHAAALTYYSLLSLFPALLFGVAALGFFGGQGLITDATDYLLKAGAPRETVDAVSKALESAQSQRSTAATALIVALATSLYGASGAFGAVGRALNIVWRVEEGRTFIRKKVHDVAWTAVLLVLVLITFVLIFVGGSVAQDLLGKIGLGDFVGSAWLIARWPAALVSAMLIYAIVYYAAPNVEVPRFQFISPGAVVGVVAWIVASAGFFYYVSNFSSYSATYGAFAAVVILLVWLWLTNQVLLLGAELNAVIDLRRAPELPRSYDGPSLPEKVPADV